MGDGGSRSGFEDRSLSPSRGVHVRLLGYKKVLDSEILDRKTLEVWNLRNWHTEIFFFLFATREWHSAFRLAFQIGTHYLQLLVLTILRIDKTLCNCSRFRHTTEG